MSDLPKVTQSCYRLSWRQSQGWDKGASALPVSWTTQHWVGARNVSFLRRQYPPPHISRLCGETKDGVSRGLRGYPRLPKGASSESEKGACRTPNIPGGETVHPPLSPRPMVPTSLALLFFPDLSPQTLPSLHPFPFLTQSRNSSSPQHPHPPAILHHGLPRPFPPKSPPPPPSWAPLPNLSFPSLCPGVPGTPGGLPAPLAPGPGRRGRCGTAPGPATPARGRYHARASEQLGRLGPPASKSRSDWLTAAGKAGPVGGRTPWWPGLR